MGQVLDFPDASRPMGQVLEFREAPHDPWGKCWNSLKLLTIHWARAGIPLMLLTIHATRAGISFGVSRYMEQVMELLKNLTIHKTNA